MVTILSPFSVSLVSPLLRILGVLVEIEIMLESLLVLERVLDLDLVLTELRLSVFDLELRREESLLGVGESLVELIRQGTVLEPEISLITDLDLLRYTGETEERVEEREKDDSNILVTDLWDSLAEVSI